MEKNNSRPSLCSLIGSLAAASILISSSALAETTLRFSHLGKPHSEQDEFVQEFAQQVEQRTEGRVKIKVYPASQLGDWTEVQEHLMQGAVDMAMQPLSPKFDKTFALAWFPYAVEDYQTAGKAFFKDGYMFEIIDKAVKKTGISMLGAYFQGMGGAGFVKEVPEPRNPDAQQNMKVRVWPGGTTHRALLERLGYKTTPLPWSELYTAQQTGIVDGAIGGTPLNQVESFLDITKTWIQLNDHAEVVWLLINSDRLDSLSEQDQKILAEISNELTSKRLSSVEESELAALNKLREQGVNVVTFSPEEMANIVSIVRKDVWPKIADEIGEEAMKALQDNL